MPSLSRSQRDLLKAAAALAVIIVGLLVWLRWKHAPDPTSPAMTAGTVVQSTPSGSRVGLTVDYTVDGRLHRTTGTVPAARYTADGKVVWVCFSPKSPGDAGMTRLRLPTDPLCDEL